ncbi:MAG: sigma-70 family RNA polymerase sigma factor [Bacteroidales bacterium]|jgi:RNA polymerase sigma-70 factor (ECF subfamily)
MNEQEVLDLLLAGDPAAIRSLVDQYQPLVLRTALGFVRNTEDARDVAQEVFIDILTNLHRFKAQSGLSTWIYRITVNRSLNYLRSSKRRKDRLSYSDDYDDGGSKETTNRSDPSQKNPAELLEQKERSKILHAAIRSLPDKQQIAFNLAEYDDLSYKEIAEIMKLSLSSVESLLFRARKNLQKRLWKCCRRV